MGARQPGHKVDVLRFPISADEAAELLSFWERVFEESFDRLAAVLAGVERDANDDVVYIVRGRRGALASTCRLTICRADRRLGLLGEVATDDAYRGCGLASRLCALARDEFSQQGGRTLFLATSNPAARRLYERLGWRRLANANVMVWQAEGGTLATLAPVTRPGEAFAIVEGSASLRAPIVPCITRDHPWLMLDANAGILSTRHVLQPSCEGLFSRYHDVVTAHDGVWLAALASPGHVLGMATVASVPGGRPHRIDAFAEHGRQDVWVALLHRVRDIALDRGPGACEWIVAERDTDKRQWLAAEGFTDAGEYEPMRIEGAWAASRRMTFTAPR